MTEKYLLKVNRSSGEIYSMLRVLSDVKALKPRTKKILLLG